MQSRTIIPKCILDLLKIKKKKDFIIINVVSPMRHIRILQIYRNTFGRSR